MKEVKFQTIQVKRKGAWTTWQLPVMNRYHMACCDCSLVHTINFRVLKTTKAYKRGGGQFDILPKSKYRVQFKMFRNERLTASQRQVKKCTKL